MAASDLEARLAAVQAGGQFSPGALARFAEHLRAAPEEQLYRMSPLRYAVTAGLDERTAIDLFLHATHAGVLEFSWGVLCPACASFLTTAAGLRSLAREQRCNLCQIPVAGLLDDNVEVAFTASPSVRHLRFHEPEALDVGRDGFAVLFSSSLGQDSLLRRFIGEKTIWSGRVARGESQTVAISLAPGRYVLLSPANHAALHFEAVQGGARELRAELLEDRAVPEQGRVGAGRAVLSLQNRARHAALLLLFPDPLPPPEERHCAAPPAHTLRPYLTGKRLLTSQVFRELFRAESIPSEGGLELKSLTLLFTDLKSSTEMYERIGDLRAFDLVRQHFDSLREAVAAHGGAVVKTIGDAIMASFAEPQPALEAAVAMNRALGRLGGREELVLKIGLHAGPCIAVELNDRLDYFGRTVNLAARVQGLAEAREIVCTAETYAAPGVEAASLAAGLAPRREAARMKGIAEAIPVVRLRA
ncbi:MAG TPA: DUF5939 domain-containing protein [Myxococcota bacterium]|nr:DUF5939 domain-containing protein [Myxococcota bacterium]HRY94490.1 DUF5939 domain-containing protein [Myxococcota bacterium]HSA20062.1 DUF5939 domain-containing protein [Myxococcota bacterium]